MSVHQTRDRWFFLKRVYFPSLTGYAAAPLLLPNGQKNMKLYPLIIAGILGAATVSQGTVTITNAGFEDPAHTGNDGTNPTGWTVFESVLGSKQIRTRNNYKNTGAMGVQVGAGQSNHDGELYQTVATVIGQEYTFSIYAAATSNSETPATQNFTVELLAGTARNTGSVHAF